MKQIQQFTAVIEREGNECVAPCSESDVATQDNTVEETRQDISQLIESFVRPRVIGKDLEATYRRMTDDKAREAEALEWAEANVGDFSDETR